MNFSTYRFTLDLQKHQSQMSIATFQYDTAVKLSIGLTDGGVPYYLEDGCIAALWGKKANGGLIAHTCSIESNTKIIYEFNKETANEIGVVDCQIRIYKEGEEIITAPKFIIVVAERVVNDAEVFDAGDGAFEEQFSALDNLFTQESGRRIAEDARVEAEKERQSNELLRKEEELSRIEFETQRQTDEVKRVKAEEERTEAEDARVEAEKLRQVQYDNIENIMYKATEGLSYTLSSDGTYYEVSGIGTATDTDIVMPMFYEDLPVKSISENAFENNTKINSITIPESITYIGNYAFSGCTKLTEINFNATNMRTKLENNYTFSNAGKDGKGIKVTIGKNVTKIPNYLFSPHHSNMSIAPNITNVIFEDGCVCKEIGMYAFWMCRNLTDIALPMGLTTISTGAFGFTSLTNVKLPSNFKSLNGYVFSSCYSLLSIMLPKSITTFGAANFNNCEKLTIYCESESKPSGWSSDWNDDCPVVWGVPLDFPGVNEKLEKYKSESKEYADGIKDDLLNGAGEAYDTLKELGDALEKNKDIIEVIKAASENKVEKTTLANRLYGTKSDKSQTVYLLDKNATANSVPQRTPTGQLRVALTPENDDEATSKKFVEDGLANKLDKTTEANKIYGTDANGNQRLYAAESRGQNSGVAFRVGGGYLNQPNPTQDWHGSNKGYTDKKDNEVKAYADSRINPLEDRVADLENLTLSYHEITSTDYEKAVPADVGKPARVKMIGGATEKVVSKNLVNPKDIEFDGATETTVNADGSISFTIYYENALQAQLYNTDFGLDAGKYYYLIEGVDDVLNNTDSLYVVCNLPEGEEYGDQYYADSADFTVKIMVYKYEDSDTIEFTEAPEGTVFEPYHEPYLEGVDVERIESIGADDTTVLDSFVIPEVLRNYKNAKDGINANYYNKVEFVDDKVNYTERCLRIVLKGTESWKENSKSGDNKYFYMAQTEAYVESVCICDSYEQKALSTSNTLIGVNIASVSGTPSILVRPENADNMSVSNFKAQLSSKPITLLVALKTARASEDITNLLTETIDKVVSVQQGGKIRVVSEDKLPVPITMAYVTRKE